MRLLIIKNNVVVTYIVLFDYLSVIFFSGGWRLGMAKNKIICYGFTV